MTPLVVDHLVIAVRLGLAIRRKWTLLATLSLSLRERAWPEPVEGG